MHVKLADVDAFRTSMLKEEFCKISGTLQSDLRITGAEVFILSLPSSEGQMKQEDDDLKEDQLKDDATSFLTERQIEVLKLRSKGRSQQDVANVMGTTRSNISILEKRAHQNISRAKTTLRQWMTIQAPISLKITAGTDVFDIPARIFQAADRMSIQLPATSLDIIVQLRREAPELFKKRSLLQNIEIYVTEDGELIVQEPSQ
jgi:HTH-type transcriptional regulator, fmd operon transcriptional regulator